jgi:AraC-like DNA-binding protein
MPSSRVFAFSDPYDYQTAVRAANVEVFPSVRGDFHSDLVQIDLNRVWMQGGSESLPAISHVAATPERAAVEFLADVNQPPLRYNGVEVSPGEIIFSSPNKAHRRSVARHSWASMSLTPTDLAAAGRVLADFEIVVPSACRVIRPPPALMARLRRLHQAASKLARNAPDRLAHTEAARSLEEALVHAMIGCLAEGMPVKNSSGGLRHSAIMARFEEFLAANHDRPLYLAEICAALVISERMLWVCCTEQFGMGPLRYFWLRRMHLARRALRRADPTATTVTAVATHHGFWELGRFSVDYRALFGESPSASLRRPAKG